MIGPVNGRRRSRVVRTATLLGTGVAALALSGCGGGGGGGGGGGVPAPDAVVRLLGAQLGSVGVMVDPGSLTCDNVAGVTAGASLTCGFTTDGQPVGLTATVTSVDGSKIGFTVETQAKAVPAATLAKSVEARVGKELGAAISGATCAGALEPAVGKSATCTLTSGAETRDVTVAVTAVDGGRIDYTITPR